MSETSTELNTQEEVPSNAAPASEGDKKIFGLSKEATEQDADNAAKDLLADIAKKSIDANPGFAADQTNPK